MNTPTVPKILVIDDDAMTRKFFATYLAELGFDAVFARDGIEGYDLVESQTLDLVITDLYMERMDGFAVLKKMGQSHPDTPVVVLSGADNMDAAIQALRLGAWDYLRKPIEQLTLLNNTLVKVLERSRLIKENRRYNEDLEKMVAAKTAEIRSGELRFRTMADFAYDWECWLSPQVELVYTSPSCERITGYKATDFEARPELMIDIVHKEDRAAVARHYQEAGPHQDSDHLNFRLVTRGGQTRWISHNCRAVYDGEGRYLGRRMSNRDITRQKRYEKDLEKQRMELVEKSKHLERANHALKALLDHREVERQSIEASLLANLQRHVFPYLDQLAAMDLSPKAQSFLQIIANNIEELVTPMNLPLSTAYKNLTPVEAGVADLIRLGKGTKEIADLKHISPRTVAIHRNKIRKKLGLVHSKTNLQAYLQSLR
jgi:PAS domain S-box-containing protein